MSGLVNNSLPRKRNGIAKKRKRAAAFALAAGFTLLSLTGCGEQSISSGSAAIESPVVVNYIVNNPLTFEEHREGNGEEFEYVYITVNGLKDEEIEQSINKRIKEVFDSLRVQDLPPYRGIKTVVAEDVEIMKEWINTGVAGNFNNILSITVSKYTSCRNPSDKVYSEKGEGYYDNMRYFSEEETLNFDLNTGEELSLKDLFCDDVNYLELINDHMGRYLAESHAAEEGYFSFIYGGLKQVESFKGLSEDQKFSVYPHGIALVFDYKTPQFDTEFSAISHMINFSELGDCIAVAKRFYNKEENIFTSEEPAVKSLSLKAMKDDVSGSESRQDGHVYIYRNWRWSSGLPEEIRNRLEGMLEVDQQAVDEANAYFRGMPEAEINEKGGAYYDISVYVGRFGRYINISKRSGLYMPHGGGEVFENHCYDSDLMEEIGLEDLFKEGFDYQSVIVDAIGKTIAEYDISRGAVAEKDVAAGDEAEENEAGEPQGTKYGKEQYEELFERIYGFQLDTDAISIYIAHEMPGSQFNTLYVYIPYADFGCDNMNIFR